MSGQRPVRARIVGPGAAGDDPVVVVGALPGGATARIEWLDPAHAILVEEPSRDDAAGSTRTRLTLGPIRRGQTPGSVVREVVVDGWRFEVELEPEERASLRERARRAGASAGPDQPVEIRAEIPGRVAALAVGAGQAVTVGQPLLVIEAMKMLNEIKAPRGGTIARLCVSVGAEVDLGDVLAVLE